jgi:hypothetical protein
MLKNKIQSASIASRLIDGYKNIMVNKITILFTGVYWAFSQILFSAIILSRIQSGVIYNFSLKYKSHTQNGNLFLSFWRLCILNLALLIAVAMLVFLVILKNIKKLNQIFKELTVSKQSARANAVVSENLR